MLIILRAVSGACKSTIANHLIKGTLTSESRQERQELERQGLAGTALWAEIQMLREKLAGLETTRTSADDYHYDEQGNYNFDPAKLSAAHGFCLRRTIEWVNRSYVQPGKFATIVDNTNCSIAEVASYCQLGNAYLQELHVLTILVDPLVAWRRNQHDTPLTHVIKQDLVLRQSILEWPPWWPQKVFAL